MVLLMTEGSVVFDALHVWLGCDMLAVLEW